MVKHIASPESIAPTIPTDVAGLIQQINALQPGKQQQKQLLFQKLFPAVEGALARDVPQKAIVGELAKMGLPLSLGGFRSLLDAERKRRAEAGDTVCCEHCGAPLHRHDPVEAIDE